MAVTAERRLILRPSEPNHVPPARTNETEVSYEGCSPKKANPTAKPVEARRHGVRNPLRSKARRVCEGRGIRTRGTREGLPPNLGKCHQPPGSRQTLATP